MLASGRIESVDCLCNSKIYPEDLFVTESLGWRGASLAGARPSRLRIQSTPLQHSGGAYTSRMTGRIRGRLEVCLLM